MLSIKNINRLFLAYLNLYINSLNAKLKIFIILIKKSNKILKSSTKGALSLKKGKKYPYRKGYN